MKTKKIDYNALACKGIGAVLEAMRDDSLNSMVDNETLTPTVVSGLLYQLKDTKDDAYAWMRSTLEMVAHTHCERLYKDLAMIVAIRVIVM